MSKLCALQVACFQLYITFESSDYSEVIKIFHKSTMSKRRKYLKGPEWMAWTEDQINKFSKSDEDVVTDNNLVIDHTFPFLDIRFSRLDNNCNTFSKLIKVSLNWIYYKYHAMFISEI